MSEESDEWSLLVDSLTSTTSDAARNMSVNFRQSFKLEQHLLPGSSDSDVLHPRNGSSSTTRSNATGNAAHKSVILANSNFVLLSAPAPTVGLFTDGFAANQNVLIASKQRSEGDLYHPLPVLQKVSTEDTSRMLKPSSHQPLVSLSRVLQQQPEEEPSGVKKKKSRGREEYLGEAENLQLYLKKLMDSASSQQKQEKKTLLDSRRKLRGEDREAVVEQERDWSDEDGDSQRRENRRESLALFFGGPQPAHKKKPDFMPIVLVPSSPSAPLQIFNIQEFLEGGIYEDPVLSFVDMTTGEPTRRERNTSLVVCPGSFLDTHKFRVAFRRFEVVDTPSKVQDWSMVCAAFVTGHEWELEGWFPHGAMEVRKPSGMFRQLKGFCAYFEEDPVPVALKQWSVLPVVLSKKRIKTKCHVSQANYFWETLYSFLDTHERFRDYVVPN